MVAEMTKAAAVAVSAVVPAYGRPPFLREAIDSALAQTLPVREVIVVDDCSPEPLSPIVEPFGERVRYLRQPRNQGPNAARNAGAAVARGDVLAFLDDDDVWLPHKIERQVARLADGYAAALCGWQYMGRERPQLHAIDEVTEALLRRGNPYAGTTGLVMRRDVWQRLPFDEAIRQGDDWDLYVRLAQEHPLAYVREVLFMHRYGGHDGITMSAKHESPEELMQRATVARKHRAWLGEWCYRNQLAGYLLNHIGSRPAKHRYLVRALREAGLPAMLTTMARMYRRSRRRHG